MEMTINLPRNYVEIEEEEMMYLDGGDGKNFAKNIYGIAKSAALKRAAGIPSMAALAKIGYWTAVTTYPAAVAKIASWTGNPIIIGIAALGAVAAVTYLWNVRVFY